MGSPTNGLRNEVKDVGTTGGGAVIRHKAKSQHVPLQGETRRGEPGPVPGLRENSVVDKQLTYDFAAVYAVHTQCL